MMTMVISGSDGVTFPDSTNQFSGGAFSFKNRIINGDMRIDQRNAGASFNNVVGGKYSVDRFYALGAQASKFSIQQNAGSISPPAGFTNYIGCTSLSAYSVLSGDYFGVVQIIEGYNVADLGLGTSSAKTVTLSFWVRSSLTGTFGGSLNNGANNRSYPFTYSISVADTWEQKSVTIAGDTTGTWLNTNGAGLYVVFSLGMGSTYSGTAGAWAGATHYSATGATSVVGTNGATWYITGVQLEVGSVATPFERRPYGTELALCQRYFQLITAQTVLSRYASANEYSTMPFFLPVTMRAPGTISVTTSQAQYIDTGGTATNTTSIVGGNATVTSGNIVVSTTSILSLKQSTAGQIANGASISSEL
jgi:hypothetical protein